MRRRCHLSENPLGAVFVLVFVAVQELRELGGRIVRHTASVLPGAAQWAQVQMTLFGVTSYLRDMNMMPVVEGNNIVTGLNYIFVVVNYRRRQQCVFLFQSSYFYLQVPHLCFTLLI